LSFADVRALALAMPEVVETTAFGMPAFKAGKTRFAGRPVQRPEIEPNTLGLAMSLDERARVIAARPDVYYVTPHFANYRAVLVRLDAMRRDDLREALARAWSYAMERQARPKKAGRTSTAPRRAPTRRRRTDAK
jgi:hypothetical protein